MTLKEIGKTLHKAALESDMTMSQLCNAAGVHYRTLYRIFDNGSFSFETAQAVARQLGYRLEMTITLEKVEE